MPSLQLKRKNKGMYQIQVGSEQIHTLVEQSGVDFAKLDTNKRTNLFAIAHIYISTNQSIPFNDFVFDEIAAIKNVCGKIRLKVILETGELSTLDNIRKASDIAIYAGADFIKTSTGKIQPASTMPVTLVMLEAIKDYYIKTNIQIGMKPAGGISNAKNALQYLVMLNETLGSKWMTNEWFRFGASSLANDLLLQLGKEKYNGVYYSKDYISLD